MSKPRSAVKEKPHPQKAPSPRAPKSASQIRQYDALVRVGTTLSFDSTGEKLRITKIEGEKITFEKLP